VISGEVHSNNIMLSSDINIKLVLRTVHIGLRITVILISGEVHSNNITLIPSKICFFNIHFGIFPSTLWFPSLLCLWVCRIKFRMRFFFLRVVRTVGTGKDDNFLVKKR
jgi:hypothetical protein